MICAAPGKVLLVGEHAVVYGRPALAVPLAVGARARIVDGEAPGLTLRFPSGATKVAFDGEGPVAEAFRALTAASRLEASVEVSVEIPARSGLGSSAAMAVAIARALDPSADDGTVIERASAWEKVFHGNPSGVDVAVAAIGKPIRFTRDCGAVSLPAFPPLVVCIGESGVASSTKRLVDHVARRRGRDPALVESLFDALAEETGRAEVALLAGDHDRLGEALNQSHAHLAGLGVSRPELETLVAMARGAGAAGAKLTGAGGGGCVVAIPRRAEDAQRILDAWRAGGFSGFVTEVRAEDSKARTPPKWRRNEWPRPPVSQASTSSPLAHAER